MGLHIAFQIRPAWWQWRDDFLISCSTQIGREVIATDTTNIIEHAAERNRAMLTADILRYGWTGHTPQITDLITPVGELTDPLSDYRTIASKCYMPAHIWYSTSHARNIETEPIAVPEATLLIPVERGCNCATCIYGRMSLGRHLEAQYRENSDEWTQVGQDNEWLSSVGQDGYNTEVGW